MNRDSLLICLFLLLLSVAACSTPARDEDKTEAATVDVLPELIAIDRQAGEKLRVVATTNLVADVVERIGGDTIEMVGLLPPGADPHGYQATPDDLRAINDAHLLFVNGLGLEESLESILDDARDKMVSVNVGVETLTLIQEHTEEPGDTPHENSHNPHTWWRVAAVEQWTRNIEQSLVTVDPTHASRYTANAKAYRSELTALQAELKERISQVPTAQRKIATDHDTMAYFAHDFDFQVVGLIVPAFSSLAEPSAKHLAELQDQIQAEGVRAIFFGSTVNPRQAEQLARDLSIRVVPIFTDSLSAPDGPAPNYLEFMRYNVGVIVDALANP